MEVKECNWDFNRSYMLFLNLSYFVKTVECKSFTLAAEELFVSQSAVSKSIKNLEDELKVSLIDRNYRTLTLTEQGEIVYKFAKEIIENYELKKKQMLKKLDESDNILKFGLPPAAGSIYFYSKIFEFKDCCPNIDLKIEEVTGPAIVDKLLNNKIDIGVVINPFKDERFEILNVFESESVLVVSEKHRLAKEKEIEFRELSNENFIHVTKEYMYHDVFLEKCKEAGFEPNIIFQSKQWDLILAMVEENQGITILPRPLVEKYFIDNISLLKLTKPSFPWSLLLIYLKNQYMRESMKCFIELFYDDI